MGYNALSNHIKTGKFLDVHFDLVKDIYYPYHKPNDDTLYINSHRFTMYNHFIKTAISFKLNLKKNFRNFIKSIFDNSVPNYDYALKKRKTVISLICIPTHNQDENIHEDLIVQHSENKLLFYKKYGFSIFSHKKTGTAQ